MSHRKKCLEYTAIVYAGWCAAHLMAHFSLRPCAAVYGCSRRRETLNAPPFSRCPTRATASCDIFAME